MKKLSVLFLSAILLCSCSRGAEEAVVSENSISERESATSSGSIEISTEEAFAVSSVIPDENVTENISTEQKRAAGEFANDGLIAKDGEWFYYANGNDDFRLYKVKDDGTGRCKLSDLIPTQINVADDWIYCVAYGDIDNEENGYLYKISADGKETVKLFNMPISTIIMENNWIYFTTGNSAPTNVCKMRTDGSEYDVLKKDVWRFCVNDGFIYYINYNDSGLFKMKTDGTEEEKIIDKNSYFTVDGGYIYFIDDYRNLIRMKTDGSEEETLINFEDFGYSARSLVLAGDRIYFNAVTYGLNDPIDPFETNLYSMRTDGTELALLESWFSVNSHVHVPLGAFDIIDDNIYYKHGNTLKIMKTDGTEKKSFDSPNPNYILPEFQSFSGNETRGNTAGNSINMGNATTDGDWVYYVKQNRGIYKARLDGSEVTFIMKDEYVYDHEIGLSYFKNLNIYGDWLYFTYMPPSEPRYKICKIHRDGGEIITISDDYCAEMNIIDGFIYYIESGGDYGGIYYQEELVKKGKIYKMKLDGTGKTLLSSDMCKNINVQGGWIYYINTNDSSCVYRMRTDGTDNAKLNGEESGYLVLDCDTLYFTNIDDNNAVYKMRTDGTQKQKVFEGKYYSYNVKDGRLDYSMYYTTGLIPSSWGTVFKDGSTFEKEYKNSDYNFYARQVITIGEYFFGIRNFTSEEGGYTVASLIYFDDEGKIYSIDFDKD